VPSTTTNDANLLTKPKTICAALTFTELDNLKSLEKLCSITIKKSIRNNGLKCHMINCVDKLPLPLPIKKKIASRDF
jgi:hypothetical protein